MEIRDLEYLAASVNLGNLGRAAKELGLEVSTVSRRIGRLEDEIGLTLLERGHSGVRLTAGGRAVMVHVRRALAELGAIARAGVEHGLGQTGTVRLGIRLPLIDTVLVEILKCWRETHPGVGLTIFELSDRDLALGLEERRLDAVITPPMISAWKRATALTLYRDRLIAVLPASHRLATNANLGWDDLRGETLLVQGWEESQAARDLCQSLLGEGARMQVHSASQDTIFGLVAAGFGVALSMARSTGVDFPGVTFRPIDDVQSSLDVVLVWHPETADALIGRFVAFMRDKLTA